MPILDLGAGFVAGATATADGVNDKFDAIEEFVNVTKLDGDNIQDGSIGSVQLDPSLQAALPTAVVAALPGSPVNGQVIYYANAAMVSVGVLWQFRYNSAFAGSKWEFIGGHHYPASGGSTIATSTSYVSSTPSLTVPLTGAYSARLSGSIVNGALSIGVNGSFLDSRAAFNVVASTVSIAVEMDLSLTAGDTVAAGIKKNTATDAATDRRYLALMPKRVG